MYTLNPQSFFALDRSTYIYDIVPISSGLTTISSDDTLRLIQPEPTGRLIEIRAVENASREITCLRALDGGSDVVCTAGRDGKMGIWDLRAGGRVGGVSVDRDAPILSLACSSASFSIAAGTELTNSQATVAIWDTRNLATPRVQYIESHSDDVTELQYHPTHPSILLSGSTDGLVNLYNTTITDEEEALHQTINHGSSVHHANFLSNTDIFILSHDEKISLYEMLTNLDTESEVEESPAVNFGDLRGLLGCEYVVNVVGRPDGSAVAGVGSHSTEELSLIQLTKTGNQAWSFAPETKVSLPGAHDSEIIRSFCFLDSQKKVFTVGEDGQIKSWGADT